MAWGLEDSTPYSDCRKRRQRTYAGISSGRHEKTLGSWLSQALDYPSAICLQSCKRAVRSHGDDGMTTDSMDEVCLLTDQRAEARALQKSKSGRAMRQVRRRQRSENTGRQRAYQPLEAKRSGTTIIANGESKKPRSSASGLIP
jgi:hypothetical protein